MSNWEIVKDWYEAWEEGDASKLHLAPDLRHRSSLGIYDSREAFLGACWPEFTGVSCDIVQHVESGDTVCVRYEVAGGGTTSPITEWFRIEDGLIREIEVYLSGPWPAE
jgi:hypothetical protein